MPVFALYNLNDASTVVDDAPANGVQNGIFLNGATVSGGQVVLDGVDDFVKVFPAPQFQLPRGTLEINFTPTAALTSSQTVLSRDSVGENQGSYRVEVNPDGSILVSHETEGGTTTYSTGPGFYSPGDTINLSYSWDQGGEGGVLRIENSATSAVYEADVPASLTMDMADQSQPWFIGASQDTSDPGALNNIDEHFQGTVEFFSLSDTVDNLEKPVANPDAATTPEDTPIIIDILGNDTDPNGQSLEVVGVPTAGNGTVTVNADGTIRYVPNPNFTGTDSISYTITDPDGNTASTTVAVTVTPVNDAPEANPDASVTAFNTPVTFAVLGNDTDVDGDTLAIAGTPTSADGTVVVNGDGTLTFTPNAGFAGVATVDYAIEDEEGLSDTSTWTITVRPADDRDGIVSGTAGDDIIDAGYVDPTDGDRVDANDAILPGETGNDDIIVAGAGNDAVLAGDGNDEVLGGDGNDLVSGNDGDDLLRGDLGNDVVAGGAGNDTLFGDGPDTVDSYDRAYPGLYPADADPLNNRDSLLGGEGNDLVYGGDDADTIAGNAGADTIYAGIDADLVSGEAGDDVLIGEEGSDTMDGGAGDDLIVGGNYNFAADPPEAQPIPLNLPDASDLDPGNDRDSLSGGDGADTIYGLDDDDTLDGGADADLIYGGIDEDSITGGAGNDQLFGDAGDDRVDGGAGNDLITDGIGNDVAIGGADRDSFVGANAGDSVDGSETGDDFDTLDLRGVGPISIVYDPANIENGTVTFFSPTGVPTGTMSFVNIENVVSDAPVANPDSATTPEDTPVTIAVLGNDTDPNGDPLTIVGSPVATNGTATVNPDGTVTFTPAPNYNGPATITYTVSDPDGNLSTTTVAITVSPANDAPDAVDDVSSTPYQTAVIIPVLGNDTDVDGDALTVTAVGATPDGTVTLNPDGTVSFLPNPGFSGETTFTYTVTDPEGLTDTATVTVTVLPPARDGIVRGTDGGELIDIAYIDPVDGDRIDGNDAIIAGDGPNDDRVEAGAGNDTVLAGLGNDSVNGGDGDDSLNGGDGSDTLLGGNGNDTVDGGDGNDVIDTTGGGGATSPLPDIDYPGVYPADSDPLNDLDLVEAGAGNDTIRTGDDADTIFGGTGDDLIDAGIDADEVTAGLGNDTVIGGEGADTIDGGLGDDLIYGGLGDPIADALDLPDAVDLRPDNNRDSIRGGDGNDTIFGRDDDDTIDGGAGNDLIDGGVDEDSILGGAGNDTVTGSEGADQADGGDDRDTFLVGGQGAGIGDVIDGGEGGDDFDTLDLRGAGPLNIVYDPANAENGVVTFLDADGNPAGTLNFTNIENVIPCFTPGTLIGTPRGEVPVEYLKPGDKVITRDNGIQEIRWIGSKGLSGQELRMNNHLQPVFIKRGALGNGLPEQDMMVSPNHRLLVANDRTQLYFDEHEVLVAAKHLVGTAGVHAVKAIGVTYIHFLFDRHEVVLSNGAWTESFQPGDFTLKGMGNAQRNEIFELFPELKTQEGREDYQAARRTLKRHEARLLVK